MKTEILPDSNNNPINNVNYNNKTFSSYTKTNIVNNNNK